MAKKTASKKVSATSIKDTTAETVKNEKSKTSEVTPVTVAAEETKVTSEATVADVKVKEAKKTPTRKAVSEPIIKCTIEYQGKNTTIRSIVDSIIEAEGGKDTVKSLDIYIQPENDVAYYVVNGSEEGKCVSF